MNPLNFKLLQVPAVLFYTFPTASKAKEKNRNKNVWKIKKNVNERKNVTKIKKR